MLNVLKYILTFIVLLGHSSIASAQNYAKKWYFGYETGIEFSHEGVKVLEDGKMNTLAGCATICDSLGDLLFYSDGKSIWNKLHQMMPNGTGLRGHSYSSQSATIVKRPGWETRYFVFTAPVIDNGVSDSTFYSEVDMDLNDGLGDVNAHKNIPLFRKGEEKVIAINHNNGRDVWIVFHHYNSDSFSSYLITSEGVIPEPIASKTDISTLPWTSNRGLLRVNHSNNILFMSAGSYSYCYSYLFNFDNSTGKVSGGFGLESQRDQCHNGGVEFSLDDRFMYVSSICRGGQLLQYDVSNFDSAKIEDSKIYLHDLEDYGGQLQLGPDGRIYFAKAKSEYLGVINRPDLKGELCMFVDSAIYLNGKLSGTGLPTCHMPFVALSIVNNPNKLEPGITPNLSSGETDSMSTTKSVISCLAYPNAITPNQDQINDVFHLVNNDCDFTLFRVEIYSRWGELIYKSEDPSFEFNPILYSETLTTLFVKMHYVVAGSTVQSEVSILHLIR